MSNKTADDELFEKSSSSTTTTANTTMTTTNVAAPQITKSSSLLSTLDQLSRDDLIKKCKGLLNIAQKAKQSKNEYSDECVRLKDKLTIFETQKLADKECLKAMQEVMDSLTLAKLNSATEISELKKENIQLLNKCDVTTNNSETAAAAIENESLKRQIQRLTNENDALLNDLQMLDDKLSQPNKDFQRLESSETITRNTAGQEIITQLTEKQNRLENDLNVCGHKLESQIDENLRIQMEYNQQKEECNNLKKEYLLQNQKFNRLARDNTAKCMEFDNLQSLYDSVRLELDTYKLQRDELQISSASSSTDSNVIEELTQKIKTLELEQETQAINRNAKYSHSQHEIEGLKMKIDNQIDENIKLQSDYVQLKEDCNNLMKQNNKIVQQNEQLKKDYFVIEQELQQRQQQHHINALECNNTETDSNKVDDHHKELINDYKQTISELENCNANYQLDCENQMKKLNVYKLKLIKFSQQLKHLKASKEILLQTITEYSEALPKWQREILNVSKIISTKIHELETTNLAYAKQLDEFRLQNNQLQMDLDEKSNQLNELQPIENLYNNLQLEMDRLVIEVGEKCERINQMENVTNKLHTKIDDILNESDLLRKELLQSKRICEQTEFECHSRIQQETNNQEELLCEMREINEAFKDRGDVITKQQTTIIDLENRLTACLDAAHTNYSTMVKEKDLEIERLLEIKEHIDKQHSNNSAVTNLDTSSDAILQPPSTASTVSRARMRDIEDVFEEKYDKLRLYAVTLKEKLDSQSIIVKNYENMIKYEGGGGGGGRYEKKSLEKEKENDRVPMNELEPAITGENELIKKQMNELREEFEKQKLQFIQLQNINEDLKTVAADTNNKTKISMDACIKEYTKQIQTLKQDQHQLQTKCKELENELIKLQTIIHNKDIEVKQQMDEEKKLQIELAKLKASAKKTNVLNLEMEDYERSLKDISQKLELKIIHNRELESTVKTHEGAITIFKNQIKQLEDNVNEEKLHSIELTQQLELQKKHSDQIENAGGELKLKLDECEREKNTLQLQMDDLRLQLATAVGDREKLCDVLRLENEQILLNKYTMEDEINKLTIKLREIETELIDTKTEYTNYKIRAQNVLRQNQTKETNRENELEEELRTVNLSMENMENKLKTVNAHHRQLQMDFTALQNDNRMVHERCTDVQQLLNESRTQMETLQDDNRKQMQEHQETLKTHRLHMETVTQCYKKQINDLEMKYETELNELKCILKRDDTMKNIHRILGNSDNQRNSNQSSSSITSTTTGTGTTTSSTIIPALISDEQKINWLLMERQEGEGSESTTATIGGGGGGGAMSQQRKLSVSRPHNHELIPLDELLNTNFEENTILPSRIIRSVSPTIELQQTKDQLNGQQGHVKHLTILLSEAEQDLAKLTQLNDMLKEELRRQERSAEREKHMHNLEYLKNVVFKFLTINNCDEKVHLVPVLNTILKLSPEETQKLEAVAAKGGDGSHRSFSSYLPIWSNHQ